MHLTAISLVSDIVILIVFVVFTIFNRVFWLVKFRSQPGLTRMRTSAIHQPSCMRDNGEKIPFREIHSSFLSLLFLGVFVLRAFHSLLFCLRRTLMAGITGRAFVFRIKKILQVSQWPFNLAGIATLLFRNTQHICRGLNTLAWKWGAELPR